MFAFSQSQGITQYIEQRDSIGSATTPTTPTNSSLLLVHQGVPSSKSRQISLFRLQQLVGGVSAGNGITDVGSIFNLGGNLTSNVTFDGASSFGFSFLNLDQFGVNGINYPTADGTIGQILSTNGSGTLSFIDPFNLTFGVTNQIPFTNGTADDFSYSSSFTFNGTQLTVGALSYPAADGTSGQAITTDGAGNLSFSTIGGTQNLQSVLDEGSTANIGGTNFEVDAGQIIFNGLIWPNDGSNNQVLRTDGSGFLSFVDNTPSFPIQADDGDNFDPSYTFGSQSNMGMYRQGSNNLGFTTSGTQRVSINNSGLSVVSGDLTVGSGAILSSGSGQFTSLFSPSLSTFSGDLDLSGSGGSTVVIEGLSYPTADGTNGQVMTTDGAGNITFQTVGGGGTPGIDDVLGVSQPLSVARTIDTGGNNFRVNNVTGTSGAGQVNFGFNSTRIDRFTIAADAVYTADIEDAGEEYLLNMSALEDSWQFTRRDVSSGDLLGMRYNTGSEAVAGTFEFVDQENSQGIVYNADYSTNFTNRSLVDKEYVDGVAGGIGGSISDNQIAVGSSTADEIEGSSNLTWNGTTLQASTAANTTFRLINTGFSQFGIVAAGNTTIGTEDATDLTLISNNTSRMNISSSGVFDFNDNNLTDVGDISSTSSMLISAGNNDVTVGTNSNFQPQTDAGATLGSNGRVWSQSYIQNGYIEETASAGTDFANFGQLWVRSSDNALIYTGEGGTDNNLLAGGGSVGTVNEIQISDGAGGFVASNITANASTLQAQGASLVLAGTDIRPSGNVLPNLAGGFDLGDNTRYWNNTHTTGLILSAGAGSGTEKTITSFGSGDVDIDINPQNNGRVQISNAYYMPTADGTSGQALVSDGLGTLSFATVGGGSFGAANQIPFMNAGATDFDYTTDLFFSSQQLFVGGTDGVIIEGDGSPQVEVGLQLAGNTRTRLTTAALINQNATGNSNTTGASVLGGVGFGSRLSIDDGGNTTSGSFAADVFDIADDAGAIPVIRFWASRGNFSAPIATRPIFQFNNHTTAVTTVSASGEWDHQGSKIVDVADPTNDQDVATKAYVDSGAGNYLFLADQTASNAVTTTSASFISIGYRSGGAAITFDLDKLDWFPGRRVEISNTNGTGGGISVTLDGTGTELVGNSGAVSDGTITLSSETSVVLIATQFSSGDSTTEVWYARAITDISTATISGGS